MINKYFYQMYINLEYVTMLVFVTVLFSINFVVWLVIHRKWYVIINYAMSMHWPTFHFFLVKIYEMYEEILCLQLNFIL
jgi:hypothetical protein